MISGQLKTWRRLSAIIRKIKPKTNLSLKTKQSPRRESDYVFGLAASLLHFHYCQRFCGCRYESRCTFISSLAYRHVRLSQEATRREQTAAWTRVDRHIQSFLLLGSAHYSGASRNSSRSRSSGWAARCRDNLGRAVSFFSGLRAASLS